MAKYLILGENKVVREIVDTLISLDKKIIVVDPNFNDEGIKDKKLVVLKKEITDNCFTKDKNVFREVTTVIILAEKRIVEDIDESISLLLGNRRIVEDIDAKTIIKAMAVRKIFKELYPNTPIRIIAEMVEKKNEKLFKDTKIDEIIPTDELIEKIMVQMVFNDGIVSELILKLLSRNDKAYLTTHTVSKNSEFVKKTYDELLIPLLDRGMQLIAIEKTDNKRIIINPLKSSDDNDYRLCENDRLIVLKAEG